jgi:hypothetical protein
MNKKEKSICEVDKYGNKRWRLNGKLHRIDGPTFEWFNGNKEWWLNGQRHREDGPAYMGVNGDKSWYLNGVCHREDGPAIERTNGYKEWLLNGHLYSFQSYIKELKKLGKSDEEIMLIALKYG